MDKNKILTMVNFSSIIIILILCPGVSESEDKKENIKSDSLINYTPSPNWTGSGAVCRGFSGLGDVNGDGYNEVGGSYDGSGPNFRGNAWSYYGSCNGLSPITNWVITGNEFDFFGSDISSAGDVNGDGFDDVIIGSVEGGRKAQIYNGSNNGLLQNYSWQVSVQCFNCSFGEGVSNAGDVNSDGYGDVIVVDRSWGYNDVGHYAGKIYVYYGGPTGPSTTADWTITGQNYGVTLGLSAACAGDVNGDGYDDIIVGSDYLTFALMKTFVFNGGPAGLSNTPSWVDSSLSGSGTYTGLNVSGAGDVNGDGYSDVLVANELTGNKGRVKLFLGSSSGLNASAAWVKNGDLDNDNMGHSLASAGDINRDGYDEIMVNQSVSHSKLYFGSPYGIDSTKLWQLNSGCDVAYSGDVNGDGYDDVYTANSSTAYAYYGSLDIQKLYLKLFIQGFYNNSTNTTVGDTVRIYLREAIPPYSIIDSSKAYMKTTGDAEYTFLHTARNQDFYVVTKHRNAIETWSANTISFNDTLQTYDFSNSQICAYGGNLILVDNSPIRFALYNGDVNQNGYIDLRDMIRIYNDNKNFNSGYRVTDLNGDLIIDLYDLIIASNNSSNFIAVIKP